MERKRGRNKDTSLYSPAAIKKCDQEHAFSHVHSLLLALGEACGAQVGAGNPRNYVSEFFLIVITKSDPVSRAKIPVAIQCRPTQLPLASKTILPVTSASLKITNATQASLCLLGDRCN